jgi:sec-independent protein translocase protein TatB
VPVFDVSAGELLALLVLALFIFGPERLPKVAADVGRALRQLRGMIAGAKEDIRRELGPELEGIDLSDLNPRTFVRRNLLDDADFGLDDWSDDSGGRSDRRRGQGGRDDRRGDGRANASRPNDRNRPDSNRADSSPPANSRELAGSDGQGLDAADVPTAREQRPPYDADAT